MIPPEVRRLIARLTRAERQRSVLAADLHRVPPHEVAGTMRRLYECAEITYRTYTELALLGVPDIPPPHLMRVSAAHGLRAAEDARAARIGGADVQAAARRLRLACIDLISATAGSDDRANDEGTHA